MKRGVEFEVFYRDGNGSSFGSSVWGKETDAEKEAKRKTSPAGGDYDEAWVIRREFTETLRAKYRKEEK